MEIFVPCWVLICIHITQTFDTLDALITFSCQAELIQNAHLIT